MISFFNDPHPGEILYSVIARNAAALNYPNLRSVGVTYFGDSHVIAAVALPCRLDYLVSHLPPKAVHTVDMLIDEHTLLPFFAPFLPPTRVTQLRHDMSGTQGMGLHMRAGVMASKIPLPDTLRFCPACVLGDKDQYGEKFWHSQHQIPGVYVCSKHHVWLEASTVQLANRQTRYAYVTAESAITHVPVSRTLLKTPRDTILLTIAQRVELLLAQKPPPQGLERLRERYVRALVKCDLATFTGRVRLSELQEAFMAFYSEEILAFLYCQLDMHSQDNWLARIVRKPDSAHHPLHHLLLMHFLGGSMAGYLLDQAEQFGPFGSGPWPCLNPVCNYYNMHIIKTCTITYPAGLNGRPSGSFACTCGFTYGRAGPDRERNDIYRRGKIIAVGELWERVLQEAWIDTSLSVNRIAEQLGVDPLTVKRYAQRLKLPMMRTRKNNEVGSSPQEISGARGSAGVTHETRMERRDTWLKACKTYGHLGRKAVRQQVAREYTWLYRHDRHWLKQNLPLRKRPEPTQRVDWEARDEKIAQLIPGAAQQLRTQPRSPRRITIAAIGRAIGYLAMIQQHLDLLPLTAAALAEFEESRAAFAIRRIQWASLLWQNQDRIPERWELTRLSGVGRLLASADIQKALDLALDELKQALGMY
jgi:hypothetical protein